MVFVTSVPADQPDVYLFIKRHLMAVSSTSPDDKRTCAFFFLSIFSKNDYQHVPISPDNKMAISEFCKLLINNW